MKTYHVYFLISQMFVVGAFLVNDLLRITLMLEIAILFGLASLFFQKIEHRLERLKNHLENKRFEFIIAFQKHMEEMIHELALKERKR